MRRLLRYHRLLYFYFQDYIFDLPPYERKNFTGLSYYAKIRNIVTTFLYVLKLRFQFFNSIDIPKGKDWVFVYDRNNYESTRFLSIDDNVLFVSERRRDFIGSDNITLLPIKRRLRDYYLFPILILYLFRKEGSRVFSIMDLVFSSLGWIEAFERVVKTFSPNSITFSNDHSFVPRALFLAAKVNNIRTIYIQHAAVTESFPPLEFDLSLLEGMDAMDKYRSKGIKPDAVKLVGVPRFDRFVRLRRMSPATKIVNIGFAFNTVDSVKKVGEVIFKLSELYPLKNFVLRKHPKDKRDFQGLLKGLSNVIFSNPYDQSSFEFILACDVLIAGDSSIHLDARLLNVDSYYFDFSSESRIKDLYGFRRNGLVDELHSLESLVNLIACGLKGEDVFLKAKYYNHLVGEQNEDSASCLAYKAYTEFLRKKNFD